MNINDLPIEELGRRKDLYKSRIDDINNIIKNRWAKLLGFGRGYFEGFVYHHPYIYVKVASRYDPWYATDVIHSHYFSVSEHQAIQDFKMAHRTGSNLNYNDTIWTPKCYLQDKEKVVSVRF